MKKQLRYGCAIVAAAYFGLYLTASLLGKYQPWQNGETRYAVGLSITNEMVWQPKGMEFHKRQTIDGQIEYSGNFLGYLFSPLIALDRQAFHATQQL
ncbi:hypothetical protein [Cerasicoccus fimbriatus]|uniref:hypothetical protein n=1 Tax=Cerasicoccus fimbriatus TaxID=3014554 RepID=UPI0022B3AD3F|nr:hypothetical protein [Cerasicoccus sp. TK19100]